MGKESGERIGDRQFSDSLLANYHHQANRSDPEFVLLADGLALRLASGTRSWQTVNVRSIHNSSPPSVLQIDDTERRVAEHDSPPRRWFHRRQR